METKSESNLIAGTNPRRPCFSMEQLIRAILVDGHL